MEKTGVEGVMSAEANLYNPALFSGKEIPLWVLGEEYIELCKKYEYSNKNSYIKAHLFKLYKQCLSIHTDIRDQLAKSKGLSEYEQVVKALNDKLKVLIISPMINYHTYSFYRK
jgi:tRNA-dihydrouridine synthase 1